MNLFGKERMEGKWTFSEYQPWQVRTVLGCSCRVELNPQPVLCKVRCCPQLQAGGLRAGQMQVSGHRKSVRFPKEH